MTTKDLKNRIRLEFSSAGHYNAYVTRYGKEVKILVTDMPLIDAIKSDAPNMRTIRTKIYQFNELNDSAQEYAINKERENVCVDYIYNDAHNTVIAFNELFNLCEGSKSWLDCNTSKINDSILELKGFRLQKFIWNNYKDTLYRKKFLKHGKNTESKKPYHKMVINNEIKNGPNKGQFYASYYSNIQKESKNCNLTGMCYDEDILNPIYEFLLKRDFSNCTIDFESLLNDCFKNLEKSIKEEIECRESYEAIIEDINEQNLEFTSNGQRFF